MRTKTLDKLSAKASGTKHEHAEAAVSELTPSKARALAAKLGLDEPVSIGMGMFAVTTILSPEMAICWLEDRNSKNRHEIGGNIDAMARDIKSGLWCLIHQGIAFDSDGMLLDGQNRLAAIIEADMAVPILIILYDGRQSVAAVDQGRSRDFASQLKLTTGVEISTIVQGVLRHMHMRLGAKRKLTFGEMRRLLDIHGDTVDWVIGQFQPRVKYVSVIPVMTAVAMAAYHVDRVKLKRFCDVLRTGGFSEGQPGERTIVKLREFLLMRQPSGTQDARAEVLLKTQWALSYYLAGKDSEKAVAAPRILYNIPPDKEL